MQPERQTQTMQGSSSGSEDETSPRLGPEFQVASLPRCTHNFFIGEDSSIMDDEEEAFAGGLPVPVTTILVSDKEKQDASPDFDEHQHPPPGEEDGGGCGDSSSVSRRRKGKKKRKGNWLALRRLRLKSSSDQVQREVVVPGDSFQQWEESEEAAFLLGLYLFGKDFNALQRFVETRGLSDMQRYYYGSFYGTAAYKRWVAARNNCSKRIVNGHHILIGWRQEELMRRMLPELEECSRPQLFEAMAGFNKGEVPFEKYVSRIKSIAGLELLIDSIALGCGKRDLTMGAVDPIQSTTKRFELPVGKAFSDYTSMEMFRALSGGCRLSKTRAQDLFWEGIWPRLLAKGWSSEQSGKGPLVFMVPGIKRYSKRSLVKGKDYFDSISEVLHHLSTDSALLEHPDLDHDLLNKRVLGVGSNGAMSPGGGDRKRNWLSKGTSSFNRREEESEDEEGAKKKKRKRKQEEDEEEEKKENSPPRGDADVSDDRRTDAAGGIVSASGSGFSVEHHQMVSSSSSEVNRFQDGERSSFAGGETFFGGGVMVPAKRNFFESFSLGAGAGASSSVCVVSTTVESSPRKVLLLNTMIKHYLGSGRGVRLYGPRASASAYKVFVRGFEQALCRNRKGIVNFNLQFDFLVAVSSGRSSRLELGSGGGNRVVVELALPEKKRLELLESEQETGESSSAASSASESEKGGCRECGEAGGDSHECCRSLVD